MAVAEAGVTALCPTFLFADKAPPLTARRILPSKTQKVRSENNALMAVLHTRIRSGGCHVVGREAREDKVAQSRESATCELPKSPYNLD